MGGMFGGGGGGGSSGQVDYPQYMKLAHANWLDNDGTDSMVFSVIDLMNTAMTGVSPYSGYVAADTGEAFFEPAKDITDYNTPYLTLKGFDEYSFDTAYDSYIADDDVKIVAAVNAHSAQLDDEINTNILPAFKAGLVNINATMSSAFVIGEALIFDSKAKKVAEADANIRLERLKSGAEHALSRVTSYVEWRRLVTTFRAELTRLYLAARHDEDEDNLDASAKDRTWDLEMYQYGNGVLAAIAGSAVSKGGVKSQSSLGGAISGALSGAAMGAQVGAAGGPIGAGGGALLGFAASLF